MNKQGKVWGSTSLLFAKNNVQLHRIEGVKGGYCSKHKHIKKYNMFYVEQGELLIEAWKNDYDLIDSTILAAGDSCVIPPGEYHRFHVLANYTVAFEIYWTETEDNDIVRENCGGASSNKSELWEMSEEHEKNEREEIPENNIEEEKEEEGKENIC